MGSKYIREHPSEKHIDGKTILVAALFMFIPLDYVLPHFGSATVVTLICGLNIILVSFQLLFKQRGFIVNTDTEKICFVSVVYIFSMIWANNIDAAMNAAMSILYTVVFYVFVTQNEFCIHDVEFCESAAIIGGLLLTLYVFFNVNMSLVYAGYRLRFSELGSAFFSDPNGLAGRLLLPLLFSIKRLSQRQGIIKKVLYGLITGALLYLLFLTGSRGGMLGLLLATISSIFLNGRHKHFTVIALEIIMSVMVLYLAELYLPDHITNRIFNITKYQEVTSYEGDRIDIWKHVIFDLFPLSPIWGYGGGNASYALQSYYGYLKAVHNSFLVVLCDTGLIGFIPWSSFIISQVKQAIMLNKESIFVLPITIAILVMAFTLDAQTEKYLWATFIYIYMINSSRKLESEVQYSDQEQRRIPRVYLRR